MRNSVKPYQADTRPDNASKNVYPFFPNGSKKKHHCLLQETNGNHTLGLTRGYLRDSRWFSANPSK
jgi:hypothetical protein